jgi:uncharacterized protein (TIGR02271 family)
MLDNQGYQGEFADQQVMAGTPVYDVNGDKVGEVSSSGMMRNALVVQKGFFFPKDLYIPLSAISGRKSDGIYLNLAKSDINSQEWDKPPTEVTSATSATTSASTMANRTTQEDVNVPVREEGLVARKNVEQTGNVHIHRGVTEERETIVAPVSHEEVTLEHRAGTGQVVGDDAFTERDIDIPVMGEQLHADKETYVVGETSVRKERVTNPESVSGTVRREHLDIEGEPGTVIGSERATATNDESSDALDYDPLARRDQGLDENSLP